MNARSLFAISALIAATSLTACGGGGSAGASLPAPAGGGSTGTQSSQQQTEDAINAANSVGSPLADFSSYNESTGSPAQAPLTRSGVRSMTATGACSNGVEFFAPDKKGDANSTERIEFYDNACTAVARDAVRIYTPTGSGSENVQRTVSLYAMNATTPAAARTQNVTYTNATFDQYGYPVAKSGFSRTQSGALSIDGSKTVDDAGELIVEPQSGSASTFCSDSAGFNATGDASLNETFGWAGLMPSGTRTLNSDGSVTWQTTHTGTAYTGAIGGLSIAAGAPNSACPLSTPMFSLAGGSVKGTYNLPVTATYDRGILEGLSVQNATLANGDTLAVQSNSGVAPSDPHFISGTLSKSGTTIASFNTDAFGDGVLVVSASGRQYPIEDWHVTKT